MIMDDRLVFSDDQAVTITANSTNHLDFLEGGDAGDELYLHIICTEDAAAVGLATVDFALETDDASDLLSTEELISKVVAKADLVAGKTVVNMRVPVGMKRYAVVKYTVAAGPLTAGKFKAFLSPSQQTNK